LGKGLSALFGQSAEKGSLVGEAPQGFEEGSEEGAAGVEKGRGAPGTEIRFVPISLVIAGQDQPRKYFAQEALEELAASIKAQGVLQPVLVERLEEEKKAVGESFYETGDSSPEAEGPRFRIIAGERRFRASQLAGLTEIPVIIKNLAPAAKLEIALIENIQREDLNPMEEAQAYKDLMEAGRLSQEEVAQKVGKNRSTVANALRLLRLEPDMQEAVVGGDLTPGHARAVLSLENPADRRVLFERVKASGLSVRETEKQAGELSRGSRAAGPKGKKKPASPSSSLSPELRQVEQKFIDTFGTKVSIRGTHQAGKIEITYLSMSDLERIVEILGS
jgi:ParB family chromosome partitioning protein